MELKLDIWSGRWLPRPISFKVIFPKSTQVEATMVEELIDKERCRWHKGLIRRMFLPYVAELILSIPLSYS